MNETADFELRLQSRIETITGSAVFCSLYSDDMAQFKANPWPAIELAIAILTDKPIVVACLPGRKPPPKLVAICDAVIEGRDAEEIAERLAAYMRGRGLGPR